MDIRAKEVAMDFIHQHDICTCPLSQAAMSNKSKGNNMNENVECRAEALSEDLLNHFQMENVSVSG